MVVVAPNRKPRKRVKQIKKLQPSADSSLIVFHYYLLFTSFDFFFAFACAHEGKKLKIKKIHTWHRYTKLIIINTQREHCVLCMNSMHNAKSTALQPSSQKVMYFMRTEKQNKQCFQILFFFWCAFVCRLWH